MIEGTVNDNIEAIIRLTLRDFAGEIYDIDAIVDTGFTGHLTLPMTLIDRLALSWQSRAQGLLADESLHVFDAYVGIALWNGQNRTVEVAAAETEPL